MKKRSIVLNEPQASCDLLCNVHIGAHIKKLMVEKKLSGQEVAKRLNCTPSMVSYLFRSKSVKVKKLMKISEVLQYDFISNLYLSEIIIPNSLDFLQDCIITVNKNNICIINPVFKLCTLFFQRNDAKNLKSNRRIV